MVAALPVTPCMPSTMLVAWKTLTTEEPILLAVVWAMEPIRKGHPASPNEAW